LVAFFVLIVLPAVVVYTVPFGRYSPDDPPGDDLAACNSRVEELTKQNKNLVNAQALCQLTSREKEQQVEALKQQIAELDVQIADLQKGVRGGNDCAETLAACQATKANLQETLKNIRNLSPFDRGTGARGGGQRGGGKRKPGSSGGGYSAYYDSFLQDNVSTPWRVAYML
jgi:DNA-binding transcriptional MerR regulator